MKSVLEHLFTFLFKYPPRLYQRGDFVVSPVVPIALLIVGLAVIAAIVVFAVRALKGTRSADRVVLAALRLAVFAVIAGCLLRPALALTSAVPQRNVLGV
ncbi:MAG: hypothetical protein ACREL5_12460, partial [Gemmatimonadales bacterium]